MKNLKRTKFLNLKRLPYGKIKTNRLRWKTLWIVLVAMLATIGTVSIANYCIDEYDNIIKEITRPHFYLNIAHAKSFDTIQEEVEFYLDERGVSDDFKQNTFCLIKNESNWNSEATAPNVHKNGIISIDRGLLMWNSQVAPIKISNACSFDVRCSINKFVDYMEDGGSWYRWFGWSGNCI